LKNVRELLYKHGHGSVDGRRKPLTSNADIEKVLGRLLNFFPYYYISSIVTVGCAGLTGVIVFAYIAAVL